MLEKKEYQEVLVEIIVINEDIVTTSGFDGEDDLLPILPNNK